MPYLGEFSSDFRHLLKPFDSRPAFCKPCTIRSLFCRYKDSTPIFERSGVYKLQCSNCPAVYIGETRRQLCIRVQEHLDEVSSVPRKSSAFAEHLSESGHSFELNQAVMLHCENSFCRWLALEHIEIVRHLHNSRVSVLNRFIPDNDLIEKFYSLPNDYDSS